jgi:hypothetical protein
MNSIEVAAIKDQENERPIPTAWRPIFSEIVKCFSVQDYGIKSGISGVAPISAETEKQIREYISSYGEQLVELSEQTWNSSVSIWTERCWEVLVDLCTASEGISDLVLSAKVFESENGYVYQVEMVYVP